MNIYWILFAFAAIKKKCPARLHKFASRRMLNALMAESWFKALFPGGRQEGYIPFARLSANSWTDDDEAVFEGAWEALHTELLPLLIAEPAIDAAAASPQGRSDNEDEDGDPEDEEDEEDEEEEGDPEGAPEEAAVPGEPASASSSSWPPPSSSSAPAPAARGHGQGRTSSQSRQRQASSAAASSPASPQRQASTGLPRAAGAAAAAKPSGSAGAKRPEAAPAAEEPAGAGEADLRDRRARREGAAPAPASNSRGHHPGRGRRPRGPGAAPAGAGRGPAAWAGPEREQEAPWGPGPQGSGQLKLGRVGVEGDKVVRRVRLAKWPPPLGGWPPEAHLVVPIRESMTMTDILRRATNRFGNPEKGERITRILCYDEAEGAVVGTVEDVSDLIEDLYFCS
eukprot:tig00022080_g23791.t1